jgi:hypothetical protein
MDMSALWCNNISIAWWEMLLIGIFFIAVNLIIFLAMWYVRRAVLCECGYPKRNKKSIKKKLKSYTVLDNLLLIRLIYEAERKCPLLYISLACHYISILAMGVSLVGFLGCMLTLADGWTLTLLVVPELACLGFTVLIEFIPDLIWLPSERKRYRFK